MQEEALKLSAALVQETSSTTRASGRSTVQWETPGAWQEVKCEAAKPACHSRAAQLQASRNSATCPMPVDTAQADSPSPAMPVLEQRSAPGSAGSVLRWENKSAQHWCKKVHQANPDAHPADSRFLKMPESCNANWKLKVIFDYFGFT